MRIALTRRNAALILTVSAILTASPWVTGHYVYGPKGAIRHSSSGSPVSIGLLAPSCFVWLRKGQTITFDYRATFEKPVYISYTVQAWRPATERRLGALLHWVYLGTIDIKRSGAGSRVFTAQDDGVYYLHYIPLGAWKGQIDISWNAGPV